MNLNPKMRASIGMFDCDTIRKVPFVIRPFSSSFLESQKPVILRSDFQMAVRMGVGLAFSSFLLAAIAVVTG